MPSSENCDLDGKLQDGIKSEYVPELNGMRRSVSGSVVV